MMKYYIYEEILYPYIHNTLCETALSTRTNLIYLSILNRMDKHHGFSISCIFIIYNYEHEYCARKIWK